MNITKLFYVALCCLFSGWLNAATYHIATTGSDAATGAEQAPWKTITKAASLVLSGDTVLVNAGIYTEAVSLSRSGNASNRITFKALGRVKVNSFAATGAFISIDGFEVSGETIQERRGGVRLTSTARNIWVLNNYFHDATNRYGVMMESNGLLPADGPQSCIISNNVFDRIGFVNLILMGSNHLAISNRFANTFGEGDGVRAFGASHRIAGNTFTNIGGAEPLDWPGHPDLIQTFGDTGYSSYDILFEGNFAINCPSQFCQLEQKLVPNIRDWTFRNNIFINVYGGANCDLPGTWWFNNLFYRCTQNTGHPIFFSDDSPGNKGVAWRSGAKNNVFLECGSNPANKRNGWYYSPPALFDLDCAYNYVGGTGFAAKETSLLRNLGLFVEIGGINGGDPGFVSIDNLDFRLKPGSPLINAGVNIPSFATDLTGARRTGAFDIGPFEYAHEQDVTIDLTPTTSPGEFHLEVRGAAGGSVVLQKTTDFTEWHNVETNTFNGHWQIPLSAGSGLKTEAFRIKRL